MPELEPITREEKLLDGEDLTPITRKEMFIKRIYDKTQSVPEPVTREEIFLKKAGEGSGGDVTIEQLDVSENGTYSESGKAYSPVVVTVPQPTLTTLTATENRTYIAPSGTAYNEVDVDVPLPENAYLLEEYEDVPTDIASFTASDAPLKSLTVSIEPVQAGSGDPSPTNVRPISGWTEEVITRTGKNLCGGSALLDAISKAMPTATISDDEITFSGSTGDSGNKYFAFNKFEPNTQYTAILNGSGNLKNVRWFYTDGTYDTSTLVPAFGSPYVSNASKTVAYLGKINNSASTTIKTSTSGIFKGAITAQDFEPYAGTTYTIPFVDGQGQSVEVYGGSVDVINGTSKNEKTKEGVDLSSLTWEVRYTGEVNQTVSASLPSEYLQRTPVFMAEQYVRNGYVGGVASLNNPDERPIGIWNYRGSSSTETSTTTTIYMVVPKDTTPQGKLVYDIATPTTFYTQPTSIKSLDGENNVWASTGQIETLEYFTKEA